MCPHQLSHHRLEVVLFLRAVTCRVLCRTALRPPPQVALPLLSAIPVAEVARAMILDAEAFRRGGASGGGAVMFVDAALRRAAASGEPPQV